MRPAGPARGGTGQSGNLATIPSGKVSSRDLPTQGVLKRRHIAQVEPSVPTLASFVSFDDLAQFADQDRDIKVKSKYDEASEASSESESESDDEDEEEALRRELEAIKKEREAAAQLKVKSETETMLERIAESNEASKLTKDWTEDVVFRVNVREERGKKPTFYNDTVRSEFHKRFLHRYIL